MDYCQFSADDIPKISPLLQAIREQKLPERIGTQGNCGMFAKALDDHFCHKGKTVGFYNDLEPEGIYHAAYMIGQCIVDSKHVRCWENEQEKEITINDWTRIWAYDPDVFTDGSFDFDVFEDETGLDATKNYKNKKKQKELEDKVIEFVNPSMEFVDADRLEDLTEPNGDFSGEDIRRILQSFDTLL